MSERETPGTVTTTVYHFTPPPPPKPFSENTQKTQPLGLAFPFFQPPQVGLLGAADALLDEPLRRLGDTKGILGSCGKAGGSEPK